MRRATPLTALVALGLLAHCGNDSPQLRPGSPSIAFSKAPKNHQRASTALEADKDLQAMLTPVPEYEGQERNLFKFGRERIKLPTRMTTNVPPTTISPTNRSPDVTTKHTEPMDIKYAGFIEKTTVEGAKQKYAIFLAGTDIHAGTEGDTVADQFTIVQIGLESVTVSSNGSSTTHRIPLQSN